MSQEVVRAVVLAGGRGTRMQRPDPGARLAADQLTAALGGIKAMIPDARGRPMIDHILTSLADAGISEVCLVVPPEADLLRAHYRDRPPERLQLDWVVQPQPLGTADAVLAAEQWTADNPFLVLNADNLYPVAALRALAELEVPGLIGFTVRGLLAGGNIDAARLAAFALLRVNADGWLELINEKPSGMGANLAQTALVSMNLWRFDADIFDACRTVPISPRGERELPMAVAHALQQGARYRVVVRDDEVLDLSHRRDVAGVAERLAEREVSP